MHLPALQIIAQRYHSDCSVACLAMVCEVGYEQALGAFRHNVCTEGAYLKQIMAAARCLRTPLRLSHRYDKIEDITGILDLKMPHRRFNHLVVVHGGLVIDVDPNCHTLWDYDTYMTTYTFKPIGLLVRKDHL